MIKRLMANEGFISKFSATLLIPSIYPNLSSSSQQELMAMYTQVSKDEIPLVRKQAAIVLNDMIKLIPKVPETEILNIFSRFYKDEQDCVRMQGIDSCVCLAKQLPVSKVNSYLWPYIKKLAEDKSWRIRFLVADRIMDLATGLGFEQAQANLLPYFCNFLNDSESEVRAAAVARISDFCKILKAEDIVAKVIPCLKKLQTDSFEYVRQSLAENLLTISPIIDKGPTNEHILPIFMALLKDENSDVRLNLFKKIEDLN